MSAVHKHRQLYGTGPPSFYKGVDGCAGASSREYYVIDDDNVPVGYVEGYIRLVGFSGGAAVVTVGSYIKSAEGDLSLLQLT